MKAFEAEFRGKVSFHEEQSRILKAKIDDYTLREVLYFIEMERLHSVGAELMDDIEKLDEKLKLSRSENEHLKNEVEVIQNIYDLL